jgi:AhpD family alkylhydroperoxidase
MDAADIGGGEITVQTDYLEIEQDYIARSQKLTRDGGEALKAFRSLVRAAGGDTAISHATKELIALAIAVAIRCEGCIVFHTRACIKAGVTREQLIDMIGIAVEMGGGPSSIYGAQALECFDQMSGDQ